MEICYDGALVMPKNYAVVDEEEMEYVDGGYYMDNATVQQFMLALGMTAFSNVASPCAILPVSLSLFIISITPVGSVFTTPSILNSTTGVVEFTYSIFALNIVSFIKYPFGALVS